jgi:BirA family biotin operon repressor/biotin-[acetyl-CoA-carboxylase] ligase
MIPAPAPEHLAWGAEALWQRLDPLLPGLTIEVQARSESTNAALIDRIRRYSGDAEAPVTGAGELDRLGRAPSIATPHGRRQHDSQPCLLVAEHQTRGRGRLGRQWQSAHGASLTFSMALAFEPHAATGWSGLSLAVGVALADALDPPPAGGAATPRLGLKWPNDLWLRDTGHEAGGRKLGGILIETVPVGRRRMAVIGIGLNVLPIVVDGVATACLQELDRGIDAPTALHRIAEPLVRALLRFEAEGLAAFQAGWRRRDLLAGREISVGERGGAYAGIDASGALLLEPAGGGEQAAPLPISAGDVRVRPRPRA